MERSASMHRRSHLAIATVALALLGNGCRAGKDTQRSSSEIEETTPRWECVGEVGTHHVSVSCSEPDRFPFDLRQELDRRLRKQWQEVGSPPAATEQRAPTDDEPLSTQRIVDELARERADRADEQELLQACDADVAIRGHIGGVAVLLGGFGPLPAGGMVALPSKPIDRGPDDICPSETAGDATQLGNPKGTFFFIDRHHLLGAGHVLPWRICGATPARLDGYVLALGVTSAHLTDHGTIEVPRDQLVDGSSITVVECHPGSPSQVEADWVLLRSDDHIRIAEPLPVRWDVRATVGERIHVLGHPNQLTMKSSLPGRVDFSGPEDVFRQDLVVDNGNSGSPIFDESGRVIGIHNGKDPRSCATRCTVDGQPCCRRTRCSGDDGRCSGDGYATHVQLIQEAWQRSQHEISQKECETP